MNHVILAINLVAFIFGSAAIACVRLLMQQRPGGQSVRMLRVLLCLTIIVACNGADFYARSFAGVSDSRVAFITMNLLSIVTLVSIAILFLSIEDVTRLKFNGAARAAFWIQSICTYLACMTFSLFTPAGSIDASAGYFISAIDTVACLLVAAIIVIARFSSVDSGIRPYLKFLVSLSLVWIAVDAASEAGHLFRWFGFPRMAMSPYFLVIISVLAISRSMKLFNESAAGKTTQALTETPFNQAPASRSASVSDVDPRWALSARELDVLGLLVRGLENTEISETLFISTHTVKNHISNIYRKAGAKNRLDLIRILGSSGRDPLPGK